MARHPPGGTGSAGGAGGRVPIAVSRSECPQRADYAIVATSAARAARRCAVSNAAPRAAS